MKISELLTDGSKWCKIHEAKDKNGNDVNYDSPLACRWCLLGAMWKIYPDLNADFVMRKNIKMKIREVIRNLYGSADGYPCAIDYFNDDPRTTFDMIRQVILKADV